MLQLLKVKNLALVDEIELSFESGLNVFSGETGSGKSVLIESIGLLLGARASQDWIRDGAEEAVVEGLFNIEKKKNFWSRLQEFGFDLQDGELLIRRHLSRSGKGKIYINSKLSTLQTLQEVTEGLVDLCGQHDSQQILKPDYQLSLVDHYSNCEPIAHDYKNSFLLLNKLTQQIDDLTRQKSEYETKRAYLQFQIEEIEKIAPTPGEDEALQEKKNLLQTASTRLASARICLEVLEDGENGVLKQLSELERRFQEISRHDSLFTEPLFQLGQIMSTTKDLSYVLNKYSESIAFDEEEYSTVRDRLSELAGLKRKFGQNLTEVVEKKMQLECELSDFPDLELKLSQLNKSLDDALVRVKDLGESLQKIRTTFSKTLEKEVQKELSDLNMKDTHFKIQWSEPGNGPESWTPSGPSTLAFGLRNGSDSTLKPIAKVASGGELSRVMLAIRRILSDQGGIGVYLFDEIDTGLGGKTAFQVGKKLKSVSQNNQVLCITHLPQVACFADHHVVVEKSVDKGLVRTTARSLKKTEHKIEIARMIGGPTQSKKTLESAAELLNLATGRHR